MPEYKSAPNYRPDIDGVRAIAILSVVLYHAGVPLLSGGFTGVDVFFVISGYLIGGHIFSELRSGTFTFLSFYKRRAKRILPAFYVVMAFTFLAAIVLLSPLEAYKFAKWAVASMLSVSNIGFSLGLPYFRTSSDLNPLLMTWSLGVEEQFYAVIPLLLALLVRKRRGLALPAIMVLCALSFGFAWRELGSHPSMAFFSLPARAWELGAGVVLALTQLSWKRKLPSARLTQVAGLIGFALMLLPMFLLTSATSFPGAAALPSVLGTALVISASDCWINRRLLSLAPLVFIGRISYSWYLWHWPLLAFLRVTTGGKVSPSVTAIAITISFAAAVLSYYIVEQPFRRSSSAPAPLLLRYAAVSLIFVGVFAAMFVSHGFSDRYPALSQEETALLAKEQDPCLADYGIDKPDLSSHCYPASDPRPSVVLWGDSHAGMYAPALRQIANSEGYNFVEMGKSVCLPMKGATLFLPEHPSFARECAEFNKRALGLIAADLRIQIVIMAGVWESPFYESTTDPLISDLAHEREIPSAAAVRTTFVDSLSGTIQYLQKHGKHVIVFDNAPIFDFDAQSRFRTLQIPARHAVATLLGLEIGNHGMAPRAFVSASSVSTSLLKQVVDATPGAELIDLKPMLCNSQDLCKYIDGNQLLYRDEGHLTPDGARYALRGFRLPYLQ